jgi:SAM-dependent methyltransferase
MPDERPQDDLNTAGGVYDSPTVEWSLRTVGPHLHPGGEEATVLLAQRAAAHGFPRGGRVLDLGSGLGAPARFVARRFGATVVGVDAERSSQLAARAGAVAEGLEGRCPLLLGAGEALPLASQSFDAAWSQDALCHMHEDRALTEVARVLRPGATLAFSDWIARAPLTGEERSELAEHWGFPSLLRVAEYVALLDACGFEVLLAEDVTHLRGGRDASSGGEARAAPADQGAWEASFASRHGGEELARQEARSASWVALLDAGRGGNGIFVARRREPAGEQPRG